MKIASIKEIKSTLENATHNELFEYCMQLIKYKKENKELLTYILYEQNDKLQYIKNVNDYLNSLFLDVNKSQLYLAKKTIRKIVRLGNKYIKYSKDGIIELEILLNIAEKIKALNLNMTQNKALHNIYLNLVKKINTVLLTLHDDEQYDYLKNIKKL